MRPKPNRSCAYLALTLLAWAIPCTRWGQERPETPLSLEARLVSPRVQVGEPVYLELQLRNIGKDQVFINRRFHLNATISIRVVSSQGKEEGWCGILPEWADFPDDFVILAPGAHVGGRIRVNCDEGQRLTWGYKLSGPGEYTLTARYKLPYPTSALKKAAGSALVVKGPVAANPVRLTVLPKR